MAETRVRLVPEDDYTHPIEDVSNFNESVYFNLFDRRHLLGAWFRLANRPNEGRGEMTCCVYLPDGRVGFTFKRPERHDNDAFEGGGMRVDVVEPFKRLDVSYRGRLCVLEEPAQMMDPKQAFSSNPMVDAEIDIAYEGVSPMFGGETVNADGSPIELDPENSFARGHTEQHVVGRGTIRVGAESFEIDGLGLRDHSWGPRFWQAMYWYRWLPMNFSEDFAMMISTTCRPGESPRSGGMVLRDGEYVMIEDARIETTYDAQDFQRTLKAWAKTAEREYEITGTVMSLIPLRNRRLTPDGEALTTRITEGMTRFECDGVTGYGLSEYLDLIVDGQPVGKAAGC